MSKRIKYLEIDLTNKTQDIYTENYKRLQRKIKGNLDKYRYIPCLWTERFNIKNIAILNN